MHEERRRGMRDEGWGPPPRPGRPEWGPRPGRGPGKRGGERGDREDWAEGEEFEAWGGHHGHRGYGHGGGRRRWSRPEFFPGPPFPPGPPMGKVFGQYLYGRGPRARRGDVRAAILDLLAEGEPWNGYQIIQEIAERTHGVWRPSAGSVYPALQQLEDEGLISPEGEGRRRMYSLTDQGRAYAEAHADELRESWDAAAGMADDAALELGEMIRQIMMAVMEVRRVGSASQLAAARRVLAETRRSMYRILADDEPTGAGEPTGPAEPAGSGEPTGPAEPAGETTGDAAGQAPGDNPEEAQ
jgi:DNA-binding PadR family transcriptional regulator